MGTRTNEVLYGKMSDGFTMHGGMCIGGSDDVRTFDSDPELLERIVRHCSPTLAGLKCGSMFKIGQRSQDTIHSLRLLQRDIKSKGVRMMVLHNDDGGDLVFVYRYNLLEQRLNDPEVREFLNGYGYRVFSVNSALKELRHRFRVCPMPPEVGVFLDYPMEDVKGYIENEGRCSHCIGCWKVYGNVAEAERRFDLYRRCRDDYCNRLSRGCSLVNLIVPM